MNNKELLYKKLNCLRLEVDGSIADDIKSTVDDLFREQNLQQCNVSGSVPADSYSKVEVDKLIREEKAKAQLELVQGYYIRCSANPTTDEILNWLEDDKRYLEQEYGVIQAEKLI